MVAARSAAMGFNRLVDARYDALNPRTASREMPRGAMSRAKRRCSSSSRQRRLRLRGRGSSGPLCFALSPVALAIVFWYSLAKRFTTYTQLFLGLAMAVAPVGGWLAAGGRGGWEPWLLGLAIGTWVGGFDVLYACQDLDVRSRARPALDSGAVRRRADRCVISRAMHVVTVACLAALAAGRGPRLDLPRRRRRRRAAARLRAVARQRARSVAGQARLRSERLRRHPVSRDDRGWRSMSADRAAFACARRDHRRERRDLRDADDGGAARARLPPRADRSPTTAGGCCATSSATRRPSTS